MRLEGWYRSSGVSVFKYDAGVLKLEVEAYTRVYVRMYILEYLTVSSLHLCKDLMPIIIVPIEDASLVSS